MKNHRTTLSAAFLALLTISACGSDEPETAPPPETSETVTQSEEVSDPFEDIPDDAPIHDMDEDDLMQHFLDCDEGLSAEECQEQYEAEVEADFIDAEIEMCQEFIEADGFAAGGCSSFHMTNAEFYALYEERTGEAVPAEYQEADPTCQELADDLGEAVSDHNRDPGSTTAEWAVESAQDQVALYDCQEEVAQALEGDRVDPQDGDLPSADEVDVYGPISHPDELYVDIDTLDDCEVASIIWGGLLNAEMEGFDIDHDYVSEIEAWMDNNAACP